MGMGESMLIRNVLAVMALLVVPMMAIAEDRPSEQELLGEFYNSEVF